MRRTLVLGLSVLFLVSSLIILTTTVASGDSGAITWYLDDNFHSPVDDPVLVMWREDPITPSGSVSIGIGESKLWFSDEAAVSDVTFPGSGGSGNYWTVYIKTSNWSNDCAVEIGEGYPNGSFNPFTGPQDVVVAQGYSDGGILLVIRKTGTKTVYANNYLALEITNNSGSEQTITTAGSSWLQSPISTPGFPLFELTTGILLGVGLVGLVAYGVIRRRKDAHKINI